RFPAEGSQARPPKPGELLTAWTNDPGFRDRSLAKLCMNWTPYLDKDFRRGAGPNQDQYPDPVTYYREYVNWVSAGSPPEGKPAPRVFMFLPSHFYLPAAVPEPTLGYIINLMLKVDEIADQEKKLDAMHNLIAWLKGDQITVIGDTQVTPLIND